MVAVPDKQEPLKMTEAEYLAFEEQNETKHEFVNGAVYAMTGGSVRHNLIANNTSASLIVQLADKECLVPSNDTRVKINTKNSYRYPDVTVICGKVEYADDRVDTISNPIVIVEVLSPSTTLRDRNKQLGEYMQIPSVQECVIISQSEPKIEHYLRHESGDWLYTKAAGMEGVVDLPSIGCKLTAASVYQKLSLTGDTDEVF